MTTVKIMLSYDYCHFEITRGTDQDLSLQQTNELRKDVQRLADEAVRQYKLAKEMALKQLTLDSEKNRFIDDIIKIKAKPEGDRTINETAMLKAYNDNEWQEKFNFTFDYNDEDEPIF